ncbi:MAG TPA: single-stranded DNA-binding protein [Porphyromonadaceae bacterium]|nr:single-stranded DNA-binding protein [Porphyromonadaceae bacterium]
MSVNKVILLGNVGQDPEIKYLEGGVCLARFSLATTDRAYTTASGVQVQERTEWHRLVAWRGIAQVIEKYVTKGSPLYIEGKLQTRQWTDSTGKTNYTTEILVENMELLGRKGMQNSQIPNPPIPEPQPTYTKSNFSNKPLPKKEEDDPFSSSEEEADDLPF